MSLEFMMIYRVYKHVARLKREKVHLLCWNYVDFSKHAVFACISNFEVRYLQANRKKYF